MHEENGSSHLGSKNAEAPLTVCSPPQPPCLSKASVLSR